MTTRGRRTCGDLFDTIGPKTYTISQIYAKYQHKNPLLIFTIFTFFTFFTLFMILLKHTITLSSVENMYRKNNRSQYSDSGFTLVELMVTIAIIAALASILFMYYALYVEKARITAMFHNGYEIRRALHMYYNENARFPLDREEAMDVLRGELKPYNLPYPWTNTTILDEEVYTQSCYYSLPTGSNIPTDYIWLWPLPNRINTIQAARRFFPTVKQIPYNITCPNAPEDTKYFITITSTQVLIVAQDEN